MSFDATKWVEVKAIFGDLLPLPPPERDGFLERMTDVGMRDEVRSLLAAEAKAGTRFERAPAMVTEAVTSAARPAPGAQVGAWRILRVIGEGGMGAVFEAVRDDAGFTKRAAIKMVARSPAGRALIPRFEAERRILARLEHRNIAALLDGGVDANGHPWFALEYVEGERIDRWCNARALDLRGRVQLFRQACGAVQYAHERLIVHRDIKPANMLVAEDGTLKLLDFGIAKLTDDSESPLTDFGAAPMTAAYASPEQRAGKPLTTATDIYSLGVVLYELVTGVRLYADHSAYAAPVPPSRRVLDVDKQTSPLTGDTGVRRRASKLLQGELDAIVMMALRPEPDRRYATAEALGRDLQRWLEGRTVRAQPDTLGYRTASFARRNRLGVAGVAVGLLALIGGTVVSVRQARVARAERDRAQLEQARTTRVSAFFQQVLGTARPREGGPGLSVSDALTRAIPIIDTAFTNEPDLKAAVQLSIGSTLLDLQEYERSRPLLQAAYDWFRVRDGATPSLNQTDALWDLAAIARQDGRTVDAESSYVRLAALYRHDGHRANDYLFALLRIAGLRTDAGELRGAVAAYDSLIPRVVATTRADSLNLAANIGSRGVALATLGTFDRAMQDFADNLVLNDRLLGKDSFATSEILQPYAAAMLFTGKPVAAESLARRGLAIVRRTYGDQAPGTIAASRMLGTILVAQDRCAEAMRVFSEILANRGPKLPDTDPSVGYSLAHLGYCRAKTGDVRNGVTDARDGLRLLEKAVGPAHYITHLAQSLTGAAIGFGPPTSAREAEQLLMAGAAGLRATLDSTHARVRDADQRLAELRTRRGRASR